MTLEQLRIFVAVAEREHVTRGAQAINITQSAASSAIAALEARYNTPLFHRTGRRIELTEAGRLFLVEARSVLARAEAAERMLSDLAGCLRGSMTLTASQTIANYWLPPVMYGFRLAHPGVTTQASDRQHASRSRLPYAMAQPIWASSKARSTTLLCPAARWKAMNFFLSWVQDTNGRNAPRLRRPI